MTKIASMVSARISVIGRIGKYLDVNLKKMLYNSMVLPHLNYCSNVWSTTDQKHLNVLERLQRRAAKIIIGVPKRTPTTEVYKRVKWLPLKQRWTMNRCLMVHKCVDGDVPGYYHDYFKHVSDVHSYNTRSASRQNLATPATRTSTCQRSFKYRGAKDYNDLAPEHRSLKYDMFKAKLKSMYM